MVAGGWGNKPLGLSPVVSMNTLYIYHCHHFWKMKRDEKKDSGVENKGETVEKGDDDDFDGEKQEDELNVVEGSVYEELSEDEELAELPREILEVIGEGKNDNRTQWVRISSCNELLVLQPNLGGDFALCTIVCKITLRSVCGTSGSKNTGTGTHFLSLVSLSQQSHIPCRLSPS
jgi:hypothetical protein